MQEMPIPFRSGLTLVGGGPFTPADLAEARALAPVLVAADQAADRLDAMGEMPALVVGDMDSIRDVTAWRERDVPVLHLAEQETTDFEKCLYATEAPLYVGVGFAGGRVDHSLAVLHAMLRMAEKRVLLLGESEAVALVPAEVRLAVELTPGSRVSLFPLAEATGTHSVGLRWPVAGLTLRAGHQIGTSNIADAARVEIAFDRPGTVLTVERPALASLAAALTGA